MTTSSILVLVRVKYRYPRFYFVRFVQNVKGILVHMFVILLTIVIVDGKCFVTGYTP